jgi:hypothetical protein
MAALLRQYMTVQLLNTWCVRLLFIVVSLFFPRAPIHNFLDAPSRPQTHFAISGLQEIFLTSSIMASLYLRDPRLRQKYLQRC